MNSMLGALDGIRILDFTRHMAGPYATALLSDHGADVVKIEGLPAGDPTRRMGVGGTIGGESGTFLMWNRGKRSVALDMRRPEGLAAVHRLVETADVVVENYRPGVADEIGIGWERLSAINPRLVYCSISAFGSKGPLAPFPGTDPVVQAMSGIMSVTGERDGGPVLVGVPAADFTGSMVAIEGILLALFARERTGRGQLVDVSMLFGMLSMLATRLAWHWSTGEDPARFGSAHNALVPYQSFATSDGHVMVGTWGEESWPRFCRAVDRPELEGDARFRTNADRLENRQALIEVVADAMRRQPSAHWERRFNAEGALFAPVNSFSQILNHPHVREAGMVQTLEHPRLGPIRQLAPVVGLSDTPPFIRRPPPELGEHTREVLAAGGFSEAEIDGLLADGAALHWPPRAG